jgi:hypothetical protein
MSLQATLGVHSPVLEEHRKGARGARTEHR